MTLPEGRPIDWWPEYERVRALWRDGLVAQSDRLLREAEARFPGSPVLKLVRGRQMLEEDVHRGSEVRVAAISKIVGDGASQLRASAHAQLAAAEVMVDLEDYRAAAAYVSAVKPLCGELVEPESQAALVYVMGRLAEHSGKPALARQLYGEASVQDPAEEHYRIMAERLTE